MTVVTTTKMTAEQYLQLGRDPAGVRLELVNGEIAVSPSPTPKHGRVVHQLAHLLEGFVAQGDLGEVMEDVDTVFGEHDVRRPDIFFFSKARLGLMTETRLLGKPDLAVEVVSESSERTDKVEKFRQYAKGGVKYYWILDPEEEVFEAYKLKGGRYVLTARGEGKDVVKAEPFAGLEVALKKLWWRR